jgi:hypothetical protein
MERSSGSQGGKSGGSHGSNNALPELRKANGPGCHPLRPHRSPMHGCDEPAVKWSESPLTPPEEPIVHERAQTTCTSTSWARIDLQMELAARKSCETLNPSPRPAALARGDRRMTSGDDPPESVKDNDVAGHRQPPRTSRFTKGHSRNAAGRPRGRHREAPYETALGQTVTFRDGGVERRVTAAEASCSNSQSAGLRATAPQPVNPWL